MIVCKACGKKLLDDLTSSTRNPCPQCGAIERIHSVQMNALVQIQIVVQPEVKTYPEILLEISEKLFNDGLFGISIVVAHMACEVATERAFNVAWEKQACQNIKKPVMELLSGYNLKNDKISDIYIALTGDMIKETPFWQDFAVSAKLRNDIIHQGKIANSQQAVKSINAAIALIKHLSSSY